MDLSSFSFSSNNNVQQLVHRHFSCPDCCCLVVAFIISWKSWHGSLVISYWSLWTVANWKQSWLWASFRNSSLRSSTSVLRYRHFSSSIHHLPGISYFASIDRSIEIKRSWSIDLWRVGTFTFNLHRRRRTIQRSPKFVSIEFSWDWLVFNSWPLESNAR